MICRHCGTEIADKAIVCYRCGTATAAPRRQPSPTNRRRRPLPLLAAAAVLALLAVTAIFAGQAAGEGTQRTVLYALLAAAALVVVALMRRGR